MMEVAASISLLPGIWKDIHWRSLGLLGVGCLVGTPIGAWLLASVPAAPMKIALASAVLVSVGFLWFGYTRRTMPSVTETIATGGISGLLNGALGIGGPPIVVFFFNSPAGVAIGRASLIAFFIATDTMALGFLAAKGLVTSEGFTRFLFFVPGLLAGQWIGARSFKTADPAQFRRWTLVLLVASGSDRATRSIKYPHERSLTMHDQDQSRNDRKAQHKEPQELLIEPGVHDPAAKATQH